jgi:hypothetical protein
MGYAEVIREGFRVIHRTWQLLLVQLGMVILSGIGFFVFVGIPLAIAFVIFSIDLTGIAQIEDIFRLFKGSSDILSRYFGLVLIVVGGLLMYIILAATFSIYVFAGSVGVIGKALQDKTLKFSMPLFLSEAKRLFLPMLGFTSIVGTIFVAVAFMLGIMGGGVMALVTFVKSQDSTLALFLSLFFSLLLIIIALIVLLGILSITMYGIAALVMKGLGPMKSLREAAHYVVRHPNAFWLYALLFGGYIFVSFLLVLLGYPFNLIPVIGTILSFPYQIISSGFQTYIGLSIIAALFAYYYSTEILSETLVETPTPQAPPEDETPQPQSGNDLT